jgi:hypothetical protein
MYFIRTFIYIYIYMCVCVCVCLSDVPDPDALKRCPLSVSDLPLSGYKTFLLIQSSKITLLKTLLLDFIFLVSHS